MDIAEALNDGNLEELKNLLIGATRQDLERCLLTSMEKGHHDIVRYLVRQGAHPDSVAGRMSPLAVYAENGALPMVKMMLDHGAYINKTDGWDHLSPLHAAVKGGHLHIVSFLVEKGAYIDKRESHGFTPLLLAMKNDKLDGILRDKKLTIAKYLIDHGADVLANDHQHRETALMMAIATKNISLIESIMKKCADINAINDRDESAFFKAIESGNIDIVNLLNVESLSFQNKPQVYIFNAISPQYDSLLENTETKTKIVDLILARNPDVLKEFGHTFLNLAVHVSEDDIANHFIDLGVIENDQVPAIVEAGEQNNLAMVKRLLEEGADINYQRNGDTALIATTKPEITQYLVEHGADISLRNEERKTAFLNSKEVNYFLFEEEVKQNKLQYETLSLLLKEKDIKRLSFAAEHCDISLTNNSGHTLLYEELKINQFKQLLKIGVDVNKINCIGQTILFHVINNDENYLHALIKAGINMDVQDVIGETAIMKAESFHAIDILIKAGANIHITTNDNRTVLFNIISNHDHLHESALDLIDNGLNINHQNAMGITAVMAGIKTKTIHKGSFEFLDLLKIDYELKDNNGKTLLDYAEATKSGELVRYIEKKSLEFHVDEEDHQSMGL